ncbi:hypothetical protein Pfo_028016 [Paulownia fortunei]|nr:hypothetical protein Pfo_028016 [Paulownia fortunei]
MKIPGKRLRDDADAEVSSIVKKPSLESIVGSPKTSNSSKTAALSCENSLKNLDKGRLQFLYHSSFDTVPVNDTPESASTASNLRVQNFRGTFSKSNSFSSLNSKPKVKLVDQVVLQRQISTREHPSFRLKEGVARSIGKSMSFKSTNTGRSETKMKMLSPRETHIQDVKNTKQRSSVQPSGGESSSLTTITKQHEAKPVQTDGKSAALSRSSSLAARRNADLPSSLGEFKRPSLHGHSTLGFRLPAELIILNTNVTRLAQRRRTPHVLLLLRDHFLMKVCLMDCLGPGILQILVSE